MGWSTCRVYPCTQETVFETHTHTHTHRQTQCPLTTPSEHRMTTSPPSHAQIRPSSLLNEGDLI